MIIPEKEGHVQLPTLVERSTQQVGDMMMEMLENKALPQGCYCFLACYTNHEPQLLVSYQLGKI
jgi:hypothetical protein